MVPFDPPENTRKPKIFWCFKGDQKGTLGRKRSRCQKRFISKNWESFSHFINFYYLILRKKCPYSEFFWSVFSRIWTEFSPNVGKYGPEKLQIRALFTQCYRLHPNYIPSEKTQSTKYIYRERIQIPLLISKEFERIN